MPLGVARDGKSPETGDGQGRRPHVKSESDPAAVVIPKRPLRQASDQRAAAHAVDGRQERQSCRRGLRRVGDARGGHNDILYARYVRRCGVNSAC